MLTALLTMALAMGCIACSDDDDDNSNGGVPTNEAEYKEAGLGWDIITQLTSERTAPEGWQSMTFEPTIGKASEADPYTRIVATNDVAAAAERFGGLVGLPDLISETTTSFTYNQEGMGKLTYQMGSVGGQYLAQVDVDLKQVPHLKKILYQTPEQMGNNGSFAGTAWYRFGDVVKDQKGYYWICVRPAFGPEGKEDSHWMCLSQTLPEENLKPYKTSTGRQNYLPTGLGKSTEHMQNAAEMFYAMTHPNDWFLTVMGGAGTSKPKMFNDFSTSKIRYHNTYFWQLVCKAWEEQDLFTKVLGISKAALANDEADWHMLYSGYSWWFSTSWDCNLYEATFKKGEGKKGNRHDVTYSKPTKDMHQIVLDAKNGSKVGCVSGEFFDEDHKIRWYARYKKGSELGGGRYDVKTAISGCNDVYTYNEYYNHDVNEDPEEVTKEMWEEVNDPDREYTGASYYRLGDVLEDEDGALWFCVQNSGIANKDMRELYEQNGLQFCLDDCQYRPNPSPYSWFISLTPYDKNNSPLFKGTSEYYTNLPTLDQARTITHILANIIFKGDWSYSTGDIMRFSTMNIKKYAKVDFEKIIVRRDSLFDDQIDMNHNMVVFTNMAYSDKQNVAQNKQPYLRYYINTCVREYDDKGNPKPGTRMNKLYHQTGYTTGNYAKTMFLQDLTDENLVKQYAYDEWVIQPWYTKGNSGDKKPFSQIYPREKIREAGYKAATPNLYLWDENAVDFANPSMTSMYNEPVIICRVMKVKDRGKKATRTTDGKRIVKEYLCSFFGDDNNRNEPEFDDYSTIDAMSGLFSSSPYNYNGWDTKSLDIPFLGEGDK